MLHQALVRTTFRPLPTIIWCKLFPIVKTMALLYFPRVSEYWLCERYLILSNRFNSVTGYSHEGITYQIVYIEI